MQQQPAETGAQECSQQRVIAALTSLSALALQTSTLRFSPPEAADHLATVFLDQLVAICAAQQGALFLFHPPLTPGTTSAQNVALAPSARSLIASTRMSIEEAQTLLNDAVPIPEVALPRPEYLPQTLYWTRSLSALVSADASGPATALLLFAWPAADPTIRQEAQHQAMQLLPLLTDLVDTILFQILTALQGEQQPAEVFPTELLETVGHEFRGPLTTIQGYATTLLRHDQRLELEERTDFLHAINEASTHLGTLVDRFLELAQFEARSHAFLPAPINLLTLAQESITIMQRSRAHHLLLLPPPAPLATLTEDDSDDAFRDALTLLGDRRLLRIMLDLLLENAVTYSAPESLVEIVIEPTVAATVSAELHTPPRSGTHRAVILPALFQEREALLTMRIRDHGIGIDPEHLALIFRRFYRVDTRLTRDVNGLGLGLALCKAIVALHGGMLWVESAVGEGSTFSLVLPRDITPDMDGNNEEKPLKERLEHHL